MESNQHHFFRREISYPLNDKGWCRRVELNHYSWLFRPAHKPLCYIGYKLAEGRGLEPQPEDHSDLSVFKTVARPFQHYLPNWLRDLGSNQGKNFQRVLYYRYTISQIPREGIEPPQHGSKPCVLPLDDLGEKIGGHSRTRTYKIPLLKRTCLPIAPYALRWVGFEPTMPPYGSPGLQPGSFNHLPTNAKNWCPRLESNQHRSP